MSDYYSMNCCHSDHNEHSAPGKDGAASGAGHNAHGTQSSQKTFLWIAAGVVIVAIVVKLL